MNLGQAVAVCLYELVRSSEAETAKPEATRRAATAELERITLLLLKALQQSSYVIPRTSSSTEEKTRRLIRRLNLSARDAEIWLGMLRQILWRLGAG